MRKKYLLRVFFVTILAVLLLGWYFFNSAIVFYSTTLQDVHVNEIVSIKGVEYEIANGVLLSKGGSMGKIKTFRILRLAYAKTLARRTPVFALPEIDLARFDSAVIALTQSKELLSDLQETEEEKKLVASSLYPIDFLESLSGLEKARRIFLELGNEKSKRLYGSALEDTFETYRNDLKKFRNGFRRVIPETLKRKYVMSDVIIDRQVILNALDILIDKAGEIAVRDRGRSRCLRGFFVLCSSSDTNLPPIELGNSTSISQESLSLAREVISLRTLAGDTRAFGAQGVVLSGGACLEGTNATPFFILSTQNKITAPLENYIRPLFIGDIRFIQVHEQADPFSSFLATRNITFAPSKPFQFYRCLQFGVSHSRILATYEISLFAQEHSASNYFSGNVRNELRILEKLLVLSQEYIKENDALRYLQVISSHLSGKILPTSVADKITSLHVMTMSNAAGLPEDIYRVADVEGGNMKFSADNEVALDFSAPRLFLTESAFFRLFLVDRVLSREEILRVFPLNTLPAEKQPYVYYSALENITELKSVLVHDLGEYSKIRFEVDNLINK